MSVLHEWENIRAADGLRRLTFMKPNYIIATASTADLTKDYLEAHEIPYISYSYTIGDDLYTDDCTEESRNDVYKRMRAGELLSTSAINAFTYREFFEGLIEDGKDVIFLDMCRPLSSSYRFAEEAIEELKEDYPERTIVNVDTCCVSGGLGFLVEQAVELYEEGKSFEEVLEWIENNKLKIEHRFTVDEFTWLKRGGRVSNAAALVGTLLSIKPILYVTDTGTLEAVSKQRGRKAALGKILESIKSEVSPDEKASFRINHADCLEDAEYVKNKIIEMIPSAEVTIAGLGVIIGAHCGPGLLAVFYNADSRRP